VLCQRPVGRGAVAELTALTAGWPGAEGAMGAVVVVLDTDLIRKRIGDRSAINPG
jgi:hypothetical protein